MFTPAVLNPGRSETRAAASAKAVRSSFFMILDLFLTLGTVIDDGLRWCVDSSRPFGGYQVMRPKPWKSATTGEFDRGCLV
jgi:hypothetical protein